MGTEDRNVSDRHNVFLLDAELRAHCSAIEAKLETIQSILNAVFNELPEACRQWTRDLVKDSEGNFLGHLKDDLVTTKKDILKIVETIRESMLTAEAKLSSEFDIRDATINSL